MTRVPKFAKCNRGTARSPNYSVRYTYLGKEYREPTRARTEADYNAFVQYLESMFRNGTWTPPPKGGRRQPGDKMTFGEFAPIALGKRITMGVKTAAKDEAGHIDNHLLPLFGKHTLDECATFGIIGERFAKLGAKGLAGKTVSNVHNTFHAIMRLAWKAGHIPQPPPRLTVLDGELPPHIEARPEGWRELAKFTREEIAALLASREVELQYRVMYVVYFLTGSRFAEITTVRIRSLDLDVEPLSSLTIRAVKQRRDKGPMYRVLPVHPQLKAWLTWWLREGFELVHCRKPKPDDYLFPTCSLRRKNKGHEMCSHGEVYKRWSRHHLPSVDLRHRRLHDARRTFISIARSARVDKSLVRAITHRATADTVLDAYTTFEWEAVCGELVKIDFRIPGPPSSEAQVVSIAGYIRRSAGAPSGSA